MTLPALTCSTWPVTRPASGRQKNTIPSATSAGRSTTPIGLAIPDVRAAASSSSSPPITARVIGVSVSPGATTFAVTPWGAPSSAVTLVRAMSPALDAAYAEFPPAHPYRGAGADGDDPAPAALLHFPEDRADHR